MNKTDAYSQKYIKEIDDTLYFDLAGATGKDESHLPNKLKDPEYEGLTVVNSLVGAFRDPSVDPRSGGVIGSEAISEQFGISERTVQQLSKHGNRYDWIRSYGKGSAKLLATNQSSIYNADTQRREARRMSNIKNLEKANAANPKKRR